MAAPDIDLKPDTGTIRWTEKAKPGYCAQDHTGEFEGDETLAEWLGQFKSSSDSDQMVRGALGRMLFSGDDATKLTRVLSGGVGGGATVNGGALLIVGWQTRTVAFLASGQMAVAYFLRHHPQGSGQILLVDVEAHLDHLAVRRRTDRDIPLSRGDNHALAAFARAEIRINAESDLHIRLAVLSLGNFDLITFRHSIHSFVN